MVETIKVKVGTEAGEFEIWKFEARTREQWNAAKSISERKDFLCFSMSHPFSKDVKGYVGPMALLWWDTNDKAHLTRIGKKGRILREIVR